MINNTLHNAFPIVAAAIGNRFGIKVQIGGEQAYTNGTSIQLPAYNGNDPDYKDYAWGLLAHEAAHIRYSDFSIDFGTSVLRRRLCGALEDVRIEHELAKDFPGTRLTLRTVVEKMIVSGGFKAATTEDHPANVLYGYVLKSLRARVLEQTALTPLVALSEQVLNSHFPADAVVQLNVLLSEVPETLKSERDCLALADRILAMIEQTCEKEHQQQQANNQNPNPNPNPNQQNSLAQPDSDVAREADNNADHSVPSDEQDDQDSASSEDLDNSEQSARSKSSTDTGNTTQADEAELDDQPGSQGTNPINAEPDFQHLQVALQSVSDTELDPDVFETVKAELTLKERNVAESVLPVGLRPVGNEADGLRLLDKVQSESVKIRTALQGLVQSQHLNASHPAARGRRVIGRRLPQLALGEVRIFAHSSVKQAPNTAIHLLLDKSDSMRYQVFNSNSQLWESRLSIALEATLALALAFEGIPGVNPGITAFPGIDDESVFRVLEHGERVRSKAGGFSLQAQDSTPMTEAIWFGAAALLRCREPRKVLLVITDGEPNDKVSTLAILQRCRDSGIETVGIGLGLDVGHLFPQALAINDFRELRNQLFELSKTLLMAK